MTWVKLDDGLAINPKMEDVSFQAVGLYTLALTECARRMTDGIIAPHVVERLAVGRSVHADSPMDVHAVVRELVASKLWVEHENGTFEVPDFLDYNYSRSQVEAKRDKDKRRKRNDRAMSARTSTRTEGGTSGDLSDAVSTTPEPQNPRTLKEPPESELEPEPVDPVTAERLRVAEELCNELADLVAANPPDSKRPNVSKAWVTDMERCVRLDERSPNQVRGLFEYVFDGPGSFWISNMRSPDAVRRHFDKIRAQKQSTDEPTPPLDWVQNEYTELA